jgi:UDP-N-acetylmuramate dehydrogenase
MNLPQALKNKFLKNEPLKKHTTFRIGGPAEFFAEPSDIGDLAGFVYFAKKYRVPLRIIGAGSNILASDKGLKGITVSLDSQYFKKIVFRGNLAEAGAGAFLSRLLDNARHKGFSGIEFLAAIPGTLGGALAMNAGITEKGKRREVGDLVENVSVMDYNGKVITLSRGQIKFGYRQSDLSKYIILNARFRLKKAKPREIGRRIKDHISRRRLTQDYSFPSAGCVFKNPPGDSAGRLMDLCGLKGRRIGGAAVSLKHANFILNLEAASFQDVRKLMGLVRKEVKKRFGIALEPEIKIWR